MIGRFEWITRILNSFQRYLALFAVRVGTIGQRVKSVGGIRITIMITGKSRRGRGSPLFIGDTVTNTVLPRFFSRSSVTLLVTRSDILELSVTFGSVEWAKGTGGTDAHGSQKSNHERHELHDRKEEFNRRERKGRREGKKIGGKKIVCNVQPIRRRICITNFRKSVSNALVRFCGAELFSRTAGL